VNLEKSKALSDILNRFSIRLSDVEERFEGKRFLVFVEKSREVISVYNYNFEEITSSEELLPLINVVEVVIYDSYEARKRKIIIGLE